MAIMEIRTYPDPVLLHPAEAVAAVDETVRRLMDDMVETMYQAPGVGLAAPQVGVSSMVIVVDVTSGQDPNGLIRLANPKILSTKGAEAIDEGCLSIPDFTAKVNRFQQVTVEGLDPKGRRVVIEAEGLLARALQHEIDHVRGVLIIDHLRGIRKELVRKKLRRKAKNLTG